ncbi:hypothetical protein ACFFX0_29220 [Citricoccus parietis]|uniref:Uncharacterized protein n=1 Tax=Citricoccus parietis TaxID=592307 RepID=A0ABV5G7V5_9MICC
MRRSGAGESAGPGRPSSSPQSRTMIEGCLRMLRCPWRSITTNMTREPLSSYWGRG